MVPILVFAIDKKREQATAGIWRKHKMLAVEELSADSRAIMKGAIHEETSSTNFSGGDIGHWRNVRACPCHQTKG